MLRALVGPTASGKTDAGIAVATRLGAEIVSVDSMLVYRGMDVGTAKPTAEQRRALPHHLMDLAEPSERFTVARYQHEADDLLERVPAPLLVGGSGLYFRAVVDRLRFRRRIRPFGHRCRPRPTRSARISSTRASPPRTRWRRRASNPPTSGGRSARSRSRPSPAHRSATSRLRGRSTTPRACAWPASASKPRCWTPAFERGWRPWWRRDGSTRFVTSWIVDSVRGSRRARRSGTRNWPSTSTVGWRSTKRWSAP